MYAVCGRGFLGLHAQEFFRKLDIQTFFLSRSFQYGLGDCWEDNKIPSVILNFSGPSSVEQSLVQRDYYLSTPVEQLKKHFNILSSFDIPPHYVFISSASVYGNSSIAFPNERVAVNPISPYAEGKALAEAFLMEVASSYPSGITIIRATSVFAENLDSRVLGLIRTRVSKGEDFSLYGTGTESRDFLHVSDFMSLVNLGIINSQFLGGGNIYNVGSGKLLSMKDLVQIALEDSPIRRSDLKVSFNGQNRLGDPHTISVSVSKIHELLDFQLADPINKLREYFSPQV